MSVGPGLFFTRRYALTIPYVPHFFFPSPSSIVDDVCAPRPNRSGAGRDFESRQHLPDRCHAHLLVVQVSPFARHYIFSHHSNLFAGLVSSLQKGLNLWLCFVADRWTGTAIRQSRPSFDYPIRQCSSGVFSRRRTRGDLESQRALPA
jgi:hypothetical protein